MSNFVCVKCHKKVEIKAIGTINRNHCLYCLWSKHVDKIVPGDRKSDCGQNMKPIGLTFKLEGLDKYSNKKQGELMLVHECSCGKISINRIAGDDNPEEIIKILEISENLDKSIKKELEESGIRLLTNNDLSEIKTQLFGNLLL